MAGNSFTIRCRVGCLCEDDASTVKCRRFCVCFFILGLVYFDPPPSTAPLPGASSYVRVTASANVCYYRNAIRRVTPTCSAWMLEGATVALAAFGVLILTPRSAPRTPDAYREDYGYSIPGLGRAYEGGDEEGESKAPEIGGFAHAAPSP
ncbi:hypothetical protein NUW58_g9709 [Xylaria curta]|uniref:Uncharacterized protein n=1 Tax=Xylaria curta TaxID=42375 RepID=A0ACC1MW25_9PEZI|nr:hypothetical protein NUW58_g9709 [Xylaria curta]